MAASGWPIRKAERTALESETGNCMQKVQARASGANLRRTYNFLLMNRFAAARGAALTAMLAAAPFAATNAAANTASEALRAKGASEIYNLDRDLAVESFRQAIAADPQDAAAYRGLASALWLSITFRRGNMTVDDYLGTVIVFRGRFRTEGTAKTASRAGLFIRVRRGRDIGSGRDIRGPLTEDAVLTDPSNHIVTIAGGRDWTGHEVTARVPDDCDTVVFGIFLAGPGRIELRDADLTRAT